MVAFDAAKSGPATLALEAGVIPVVVIKPQTEEHGGDQQAIDEGGDLQTHEAEISENCRARPCVEPFDAWRIPRVYAASRKVRLYRPEFIRGENKNAPKIALRRVDGMEAAPRALFTS
jgi:hypothetical protein